MFDLHSVTLTDFRSYAGEHVFEFPTEPGLYLLTGANNINPRLGSNGAGKTTLLEAVFWALYGRTTRGLKAGDVINWGAKSCAVTVSLTVGSQSLEIRRMQSPNGLYLNDSTVEQSTLQKALRLTPEAFTHAVMVPQFGDSFFDLQPSAKLTLFSEIMELDYWLTKSHEADVLAHDIASEQVREEQALAKANGQVEIIKDDIEQATKRSKDFANTQAETIRALDVTLNALVKAAKGCESKVAQIEGILRGLQSRADRAKGSTTCPKCGQPVRNNDLIAINKNISDFERELSRHKQELAHNKSRQVDALAAIDKAGQTENPHARIAEEKSHALILLKNQIHSLGKKIAALAEDHAAVSYWVTGFKRIRLYIIEETLRQLELEVNNSLGSLGLLDWRIEFDVERENKSGGITKGFVVSIHAPGHDKPVRFEAWSGGETQRLRLAGDLGLANLIMERAGLTNTIEFYDEPSRHMSQEGLLDLAETLHQRAINSGKRVWIIDHHLIDYGFTGVACVTKGPDGSRVELGP